MVKSVRNMTRRLSPTRITLPDGASSTLAYNWNGNAADQRAIPRATPLSMDYTNMNRLSWLLDARATEPHSPMIPAAT